MKTKLMMISMICILAFSCKKEDNTVTSITGLWSGKWGNGSSTPNNNMTVIFRENGTARVLYGYLSDTSTAIYKSEGSYTFTGGEAQFTYFEGSYTFIHKANPSKNKMEGTWGNAPSTTDGGKFYLDKN